VGPENYSTAVGLISVLLGVNAFFISRLVKKIYDSSDSVLLFRRDLHHMSEKIENISNMYGRIIELEKKIAVLNYKFWENKVPDEQHK